MIFKKKKIKYETQNLLLSIARQFIYVTPSEIDNLIQSSLKYVAEFLNIDRCFVYLINKENNSLQLYHQFLKSDISGKINQHEQVDGEDFAWLMQNLTNNKPIIVDDINKVPASSNTYKLICQVEKIKSMLLCPLKAGKDIIGFIGVDSVKKTRTWGNEDVYLLNFTGDIINGALNRKKAVETGKETEQKMRTLFARSEEVVFISSPKGKFVEINPAGAKLFGYNSTKELLEIDIKNELYVNPRDYDIFLEELQKNENLKDYELKLKRKDGTNLTAQVTALVLRDGNNSIIAHEGIIRDITDKRLLEQQLFQSQKMESIGMLAGGIAHDFNNILTAMNGYAEMVLMGLNKDDPNYKRVNNILKGGKQAEDLVKQLLAFGRKQFIETKVIDINTIITELEPIFRKVVTEDIQLKINLKKGINYIKADPVQIQQIMVNLIVNAGHAIKQLNNESKEKLISISTNEILANDKFIKNHPGCRPGKYILINVNDTGTGIDKETIDKIFDPFFTTKKEGEGTGLGLSTVYGIVKQNNGNIYVNSMPSKGTIFEIFWPITKEKIAKKNKMESKVEFKNRCETILFVEDDQNVRELAVDALISLGYEVYEAINGKQALEIVDKNNLIDKIDLMITDMVMPEMGGEELSQKIHKLNPDIKIILSSGYTNSQIFMNESNTDKTYFFLSKPYTIPKLEKKIRKVLKN
ncbi:MAG: response regulator [Calditrichia bacterium]|nr:response regulator [Calditrichia bacterium]